MIKLFNTESKSDLSRGKIQQACFFCVEISDPTLDYFFLSLQCHCEKLVWSKENGKLTLDREWARIRQRAKAKRSQKTALPNSCAQCGQFGMTENGYCTVQDAHLHKFIAYCDFTSEPGYAWTLVASFSRRMVRSKKMVTDLLATLIYVVSVS